MVVVEVQEIDSLSHFCHDRVRVLVVITRVTSRQVRLYRTARTKLPPRIARLIVSSLIFSQFAIGVFKPAINGGIFACEEDDGTKLSTSKSSILHRSTSQPENRGMEEGNDP